MPSRKLRTALAARMFNILKRRHQVRDTTKTTTEAKNSSPATARLLARVIFRNVISQVFNILCSSTRNRVNACHLALAAHGTIDWAWRGLDAVQGHDCRIPAGVGLGRIELLRVALRVLGLVWVGFLVGSWGSRGVVWHLAYGIRLEWVLFLGVRGARWHGLIGLAGLLGGDGFLG